jgi:alkylation response protein AidB-like acyl-CoA dehydrogenase
MDLTYTSADEAFRQRVREFIARNIPEGWRGWGALDGPAYQAWAQSWRAALMEAGWLVPAWPAEYGGGGLSVSEQSILSEEFTAAGLPGSPLPSDGFGFGLLGPTLLAWGTPDQKDYFLPRTLSGEIRWAQGYSEPDAGSDLFSLRTRAVLDGDEWVIEGAKVWQTAGTHANWIFMLARTSPGTERSKGLSFLLVPVCQPGVEVRPITNMAGRAEFASFTFTGARTAAANIVGGEGNGAKVALTLLGFERGAGGVAAAAAYSIELDRLIALARHHGRAADPVIRQRIAACWSKVQIIRYLGLRALSAGIDGRPPGPESSIVKMYGAEYHKEVTELAMDIAGAAGIAPRGMPAVASLGADPLGVDPLSVSSWSTVFLLARAGSIYGGSSQIQRNTIAEQILGLPREPRAAVPGTR